MTIQHEGKHHEAYRLITKKNFASDILNGAKTVEIRDFSDYYNNMFIDSEKLKVFEEKQANGEEVNFDDVVKDVRYMRLTNFTGSWFLDVEIYLPHICSACQEDAEFLNESYGFADIMQDVEKYEDLPMEEKPVFFAIPIKSVITHHGL